MKIIRLNIQKQIRKPFASKQYIDAHACVPMLRTCWHQHWFSAKSRLVDRTDFDLLILFLFICSFILSSYTTHDTPYCSCYRSKNCIRTVHISTMTKRTKPVFFIRITAPICGLCTHTRSAHNRIQFKYVDHLSYAYFMCVYWIHTIIGRY